MKLAKIPSNPNQELESFASTLMDGTCSNMVRGGPCPVEIDPANPLVSGSSGSPSTELSDSLAAKDAYAPCDCLGCGTTATANPSDYLPDLVLRNVDVGYFGKHVAADIGQAVMSEVGRPEERSTLLAGDVAYGWKQPMVIVNEDCTRYFKCIWCRKMTSSMYRVVKQHQIICFAEACKRNAAKAKLISMNN